MSNHKLDIFIKSDENYNNKIIQGDALDILKQIKTDSVDAIITDPPFFLPATSYASRKVYRKHLADLSILGSFFAPIMTECERILKHDRSIYVFCDSVSYPIFYTVAFHGWDYVRTIVWYKGKKHFSLGKGVAFRYAHELILHGCNKGKFYTKENRQDVLECRVVPTKDRLHPAQKPVALLKELILATTNENDLVVDPFCGSGSTCVAAQSTGRDYLGIELEQYYVDVALKRLGDK